MSTISEMDLRVRMLSLLAITALVGAPSGALAATAPTSVATATSTLIGVDTPIGTVSLGEDQARSRLGASTDAFADLLTGSAASGDVHHQGSNVHSKAARGERHSAPVGAAPVAMGDLLSLGTVTGEVSTAVGSTVSSDVDVEYGSASMLGGLVHVDGGSSTSSAVVDESSASVTRATSIAGIQALSVGDLLRSMGADPLDLSCAALQRVATQLGVDVGDACGGLTAIQGDLARAGVTLRDALDDVTALRHAAESELLAVNGAITELIARQDDAASTLSSVREQLVAVEAAHTDLDAVVDAAQETLDAKLAERARLQDERALYEARTAGFDQNAVQAERDSLSALCAGLDVISTTTCEAAALLTTLPDLAATYGASSPTSFATARDEILARMDAILSSFAAIANADAAIAALAVDQATDALARATLDAAAVHEQIDALQALAARTIADAEAIAVQLSDTNALLVSVLDTLQELLTDLDVIANSDDPTAMTCAGSIAALTSVAARVPRVTDAIGSIAPALSSACAAAVANVIAVRDTPILSLGAIDITVRAIAREDDPLVSVTGTIGSIRVGALAPVFVDLPVDGALVPAVSALLTTVVRTMSESFGLDLPVPTVEFLVTTSDKGHADDGSWFANGTATVLRIAFPAGDLSVPSTPPLSVLAGGDLPAPARPSRAARARSFPMAGASLDIGKFTAAGTYAKAVAAPCVSACGAGSARTLPRTGVDDSAGKILLAVAFVAGAAAIKRYVLVR